MEDLGCRSGNGRSGLKCSLVILEYLLIGDVQVPHGHGCTGMTQDLHDGAHACLSSRKLCADRMAEAMRRDGRFSLCCEEPGFATGRL